MVCVVRVECVDLIDAASDEEAAGSCVSVTTVRLLEAGEMGLRIDMPSVPKTLLAVRRRFSLFWGFLGVGVWSTAGASPAGALAVELVRLRDFSFTHQVPIQSPMTEVRSPRRFSGTRVG